MAFTVPPPRGRYLRSRNTTATHGSSDFSVQPWDVDDRSFMSGASSSALKLPQLSMSNPGSPHSKPGSPVTFSDPPSSSSGSPGRRTNSRGGGSAGLALDAIRAKLSSRTGPAFAFDSTLAVDPRAAAYRYRHTRSAMLTKTLVPAQDTLTPHSQAPPVGTYNVPTFPAELRPSHKKPSSPFKSSGRASAFIPNSTMFYKSLRDEVSLSNLGPGSYNLAYAWRTDERCGTTEYAHYRTVASAPAGLTGLDSGSLASLRSPHQAGKTKGGGATDDKPWLIKPKTKPLVSPRTRMAEQWNARVDLEAVRALPDYP